MNKIIQLSEVKIHIQIEGDGYPLVILHGLTSNIEALQLEINYFKKYFQVIAIDCRGHGRSEKVSNYTLQDHINDVLEVIAFLQLEHVFILGISMGSYIAQGVSITNPSLVRKLVLVTPKAHGKTSSTQNVIEKRFGSLSKMPREVIELHRIENIFAPTTPKEIKDSYLRFLVHQKEKGLALLDEQAITANHALENFDFRSGLSSVTAETLVISGKYDSVNPPEYGKEIAELISNAKFAVLKKSGHMPHYEEPQRYIKLIEEFLLVK